MLRKAWMALACATLLGGCSSLSQTECQSANWKEIGYEDGSRGARPARADEHRESCAKHGIAVDRDAWERGYARGLETYCTPENALQLGLRGGDYAGVCPPALDLDFTSHWRAGRVVFDQRQRVARLDERRRELEYAYNAATNDQDRYAVRVQLARADEQLRYERARLYEEETRLREFLNVIR
jgi:hypothetical protein